jgi:RNA polymerase sigma-70 factor (ECF subfamily)
MAAPGPATAGQSAGLRKDANSDLTAAERTVRASRMDDRRRAILEEIPRLRRYSRALLRDRDRADDLVQDCLERALANLDNWRTGESPRKWLFTIMHHIFVDQMRKDKRRGESAMLPLDGFEAMAVPAEQTEDAGSREVLQALQTISPERRAAILMVSVEGFSYAEASTILGVPAGTLMSRIARGRDDLRALLDDGARRRAIRVVDR